jgi:hypothetical protein
MAFGTAIANKVNDHILGRTSYTMPTCYVALYTSSPGAGGSANTNEVAYTTYARVALGTGVGSAFPASSSGSATNTAAITFPVLTSGGPVTVTHFAIVDSASGAGNIISFNALTVSRTFANGDTPSFPIGSLTITET